ncbi:olfactory receptor 52E8-like [Ictalurus furcatus]|uniref:olfactory receptor 52E8-like n=1 Tax=Ictalurus furcatus TaxID=66913 RepID=UPI00234FCDFE|nr:olfactory receptor 52E8-like [Ictalurus furcatus]
MTICCNTIVIFVIYTNESLHEPMYIFITALLMNTLGGSTALYPKLLSDILSKNLIVSLDACVFQAFFIYTYAMSEFMLLSAMAYDRYVSICKPLQYAAIVQMSTVKKLIFLSCFVPSCENAIAMVLIYKLKLCNFKLNRIYCSNYAIVKLGCGDISAYNSYGLFIFVIAVFPQVIFIIYSYIRILSVCLKNSKDFRRKALQTCLPHLLIFTSFTVTSCFEIINSRLEGNMPHIIAMILSVENLVIPPLFNPIIYGLKLQEIFNRIKRMFCQKKIHIFLD